MASTTSMMDKNSSTELSDDSVVFRRIVGNHRMLTFIIWFMNERVWCVCVGGWMDGGCTDV